MGVDLDAAVAGLPDPSASLLRAALTEFSAFSVIDLAFDTPGLQVQAFAVTAVDDDAQTFSVAGDHRALFPVTGVFKVDGSTGNDGAYTVAGLAFTAGHTVVTTVEAIPDPTADGTLNNMATAGIVVSTGSCHLLSILNVTTGFDGGPTPTLTLATGDITDPYRVPLSTFDAISIAGVIADPAPFVLLRQLAGPLRAVLDSNGNGVAAGCAAGAASLLLGTLP